MTDIKYKENLAEIILELKQGGHKTLEDMILADVSEMRVYRKGVKSMLDDASDALLEMIARGTFPYVIVDQKYNGWVQTISSHTNVENEDLWAEFKNKMIILGLTIVVDVIDDNEEIATVITLIPSPIKHRS